MFPNTQNQNQSQSRQAAASLDLDQVMQGGAPGAFRKDDPIGTSVSGDITEIRAEQQTDFTTGEPLFYPNGKAKPQVVIHLQTTLHDPERDYDDGLRAIYVKGYNLAQLRSASHQAGVGDYPRVGDHLTATFSSTRPSSQRGYNDAKIYTYTVTPGDPNRAGVDAAMRAAATNEPALPSTPRQTPQQQGGWGAASTVPAGPTPQQVTQILQLKATGKTPQDVAGLLGIPVDWVLKAANDPEDPTF